MKENIIDRYSEHLRFWAVLLLRLYMGLQQIKYRPYYYLAFIPVFCLFGIVWHNRDQIFTIPFLPSNWLIPLKIITSILLVLMLVLFLVAMIKQFGIKASKWAEHKLIVAFDARDLKKWKYPILVSSKGIKGTNILVMEFYSYISLKRWQEKKSEIGEAMQIDILSIQYGGKNQDKGNRKVIYAIPKGADNNTEIHDEELNKEFEDID